jgi:hypothetical protein
MTAKGMPMKPRENDIETFYGSPFATERTDLQMEKIAEIAVKLSTGGTLNQERRHRPKFKEGNAFSPTHPQFF